MNLDKVFQTLSDRLSGTAQVKVVFGEPVVVGEKTVIPLARVGYGFGYGEGTGPSPEADEEPGGQGHGGGGGGGVGSVPLGVLEITPERTRFLAFGGWKRRLLTLGAGAAAGLAVGFALGGALGSGGGFLGGWTLGRRSGSREMATSEDS
jgi:uncharacterized spore protein YtfJ